MPSAESSLAPAQELDIAVDGITLHARIDGAPGKPWVVLLNSLAADLTMWDAQIPALTTRYRVLRCDMRGHGRSQATPGDYSMDLLVSDLRAILRACEVTRPHLVGLSLGGMVALTAAQRHPREFASMTVVAARPDMPESWTQTWIQRARDVRASGAGAVVDSTVVRWFTPPFVAANPELMNKIRDMIASTSADGYAGCIAVVNSFHFTEHLREIELPSLFIVGEQDTASTPQLMREMHEQVKGSRFEIIKDGAHLPNIEQRDAVDRVLLDFLDGQQNATSGSRPG